MQGKPGSVRARGRGRDPGVGAFAGAEPPPRQQQPPALSRLWTPPFCRVLPQDQLTGLAPRLPPQVPRQLHGQHWGVWENRWCSGLSQPCWQSPSHRDPPWLPPCSGRGACAAHRNATYQFHRIASQFDANEQRFSCLYTFSVNMCLRGLL